MATTKLTKGLKFAQSAMVSLKRIEKVGDKKKIIISGVDPDESKQKETAALATPSMLTLLNSKTTDISSYSSPCVLCHLEKQNIYVQYTDILVLRQFLKDDGTLLSRKVTGLCKDQQRKVAVLLKHAKLAGLIKVEDVDTNNSARFNRYFDNYELLKRTRKYL